MEQTLDEVEYIFVDDASPDQSIAILQRTLADYPERASLVRILTHEQNKGLPAARAAAVHQFLRPQASVIRQCNTEDDFPGTGHQGGQDPVLDGRKAGKTVKYDDAAPDQL